MSKALVTERPRVDAAEQMLSAAQEDRRQHEMQLVDQAGGEILPDRRDAAAESLRGLKIITYHKTWKRLAYPQADGGAVKASATTGAWFDFTFTGRTWAWAASGTWTPTSSARWPACRPTG